MCVIRVFMWKGVYVHRKSQNCIRAQTDKKRSVKNFIPTNTEFCTEKPEYAYTCIYIYIVEWKEKFNPKYGVVRSARRKLWLIFSYCFGPSF
jgi:hypothetical protein